MEAKTGFFYFVSDEFFAKIDDKYLKTNYEKTKRPHYCAFLEEKTGLYWLIPCSSRCEKFERILAGKKRDGKTADGIEIMRVFGRKTALLFQDMFPIVGKYLAGQYFKKSLPVAILDPAARGKLLSRSKRVVNLLRRGFKFTPTSPDVPRIEKMMLAELQGPVQ